MIRIVSPVTGNYVYPLNNSFKVANGRGLNEQAFYHQAHWGSISVQIIQIADVRIFNIDVSCNTNCPVVIELNSFSLLMNFTLSGQSWLNVGGEPSFSEAKHHSLLSHGNLKFPVTINGDLKLFAVCFLENSLNKIMPWLPDQFLKTDGQDNGQLAILQSNRAITPQMSQVIQSVLSCINKKANHHIYFEAKVLELLFLELEQLEQLSVQLPNTFLKQHDMERIHHAKILVEQNLLNPCSLIELARRVGLNDFKLKKGFREVLGTTVFGYLSDLRMEKAKTLLTGGRSVQETAYEVGYKNAHHFTAAFKKKFGYLPSRIKKLVLIILIFIWQWMIPEFLIV